jgi:hypothetical protein
MAGISPLFSTHVDDPIVASLLKQFGLRLETKIADLCALVSAQRWSEASHLSHELQGATSQYGFPSLSATLKELNHQVEKKSSRDLTSLSPLLAELSEQMQRITLGLRGEGL